MYRHGIKYGINLKAGVFAALTVCVLFYSCKEKYLPEIKDTNPNYLVIDGFINTGGDSTIFKLSRTFKLESKAVSAPERGAIVQVEVEGVGSYTLPELSLKPGVYAIPSLSKDQTKKYRLRVRTKDNKEYLSEFVESKVSPPVELTHDFRHGNLNIYANTEDATGKSRYYSYTYTETWQYRAPQQSFLKIVGKELKYRIYPQDDIYNCYHHLPSSKITIASTSTLTEDRLTDNLIVDILPNSQKVQIEYSVLVKQSVLTRKGFDFFETLKKNTEQVGSIFDAQPSQLYGNIKCTTNSADVVIGFVSAGTVTEKRILLVANNFPFDFVGPLPNRYCIDHMDTLTTARQQPLLFEPAVSEYIPLETFPVPWMRLPTTVTATRFKECADCRLQGGTNVVPPYWIY
jgi:hypothetical protein